MISSILSRSNLSALWTTSWVYSIVSSEWWHPHRLRVEHLHAQEKGGRTDIRMGWADRPGPSSPRFSSPFLHVGPIIVLDLIPFNCFILALSSPRSRYGVLVLRDDPSSILVVATFRSHFLLAFEQEQNSSFVPLNSL
jgi:hypothetical protein